MYGLNRLNSAKQLAAAAAALYPRQLLRLNPQLGPFAFTHSSRRGVVDPPSPAAATAGTDDDFVKVGDKALPEIEGAISNCERKVLPPELLSKNVAVLTCESAADGGICDVYLVGTCHVCEESRREVEAVVKFLKPQAVFLELCSSRFGVLMRKNVKVPTMGEMVASLKKKQNPLGILVSWHQAKLASELEVVPGAEFRVAYEETKKYGGKVILGDRPIQVTLRRISAKNSLWDITKLIYALLFRKVSLPIAEDLTEKLKGTNAVDKLTLLKGMDNVDLLTLIEEISKVFPILMEPLVHERDQYMSAKLLEVAREHSSVVAVVGKGHLAGIQKNWKQPVELEQLLSIPTEKNTITMGKILTSIGATVAGVAIISGIYLSIKK